MRLLPTVFDLLHPLSVIDIGCGVGTWLAAALQLGTTRAVGYEGAWVSRPDLLNPAIELVNQNLEHPIVRPERFDLAMSLEVAEHLSGARADSFVRDLCALSDCVLFSAAVPGQGGVNHINEQWQGYWTGRFEQLGYRQLDPIRPLFWTDSSIPIHYRQNAFLFASEAVYLDLAPKVEKLVGGMPWPTNVVHPEMQMNNLAEWSAPPTLPETLRVVVGLPGTVWRSIRARLHRDSPTI